MAPIDYKQYVTGKLPVTYCYTSKKKKKWKVAFNIPISN